MKNLLSDHPDAPGSGSIHHLPAKLVGAGALERFQHIKAVLAPVIGDRGVVAVYERSRHVSSRVYPWLAPSNAGVRSDMDLEELRDLISQQTDEEAAAGAGFLLKSFHDLLAGMVGESLALQILGAPPTLGPTQDKTP